MTIYVHFPAAGRQVCPYDPDPHPDSGVHAGGTHHHQYAHHLALQHGRHLLRGPDRYQRHRRRGRGSPADGHHPGHRLHLRPRLREPHLPASGPAAAGGGRAHGLRRLFLRLCSGGGAGCAGHPVARSAGRSAGRHRHQRRIHQGLRSIHPHRLPLHGLRPGPQQPVPL